MKYKSSILLLLALVLAGCSARQKPRQLDQQTRDGKEFDYEQLYRTGSIQVAEHALVDCLNLVQEAQMAGVPFYDPGGVMSRSAARLVLIYQRLGNTNMADRYLEMLPSDTRRCSLKHGDLDVLAMTKAETIYWATNLVAEMDKQVNTRWRIDFDR